MDMKLPRRSLISVSKMAGTGRTSALTRQLSHLNEIVRALEADDGSSKDEGKVILADISHKLGKLQNLVDENSDS